MQRTAVTALRLEIRVRNDPRPPLFLENSSKTDSFSKLSKKTNRPYYNWKSECNKKPHSLATNWQKPKLEIILYLNSFSSCLQLKFQFCFIKTKRSVRSILTIKQWMLVWRPCISCEFVVSQSNFSLILP